MASSRQHGPESSGAHAGAQHEDSDDPGRAPSRSARPVDGERTLVGHRASAVVVDGPGRSARTRQARLRIVHVDPWSVMKTAFLLSIALGIVVVVAVAIIWGILGAAGVWDSINSAVAQVADSPNDPTPFDVTNYLGTSRVVGFALIASVIDIVLITAIATLGAFVYNLTASLIGGLEMTFTEDR